MTTAAAARRRSSTRLKSGAQMDYDYDPLEESWPRKDGGEGPGIIRMEKAPLRSHWWQFILLPAERWDKIGRRRVPLCDIASSTSVQQEREKILKIQVSGAKSRVYELKAIDAEIASSWKAEIERTIEKFKSLEGLVEQLDKAMYTLENSGQSWKKESNNREVQIA